MKKKLSIMYVIRGYAQIFQTYLKTELEALYHDYDITIVSRKPSDIPSKNHFSYHYLTEKDAIKELAAQVKPDILHTHYLNQLDFIAPLAEELNIPFTVRSHSYDTLCLVVQIGGDVCEKYCKKIHLSLRKLLISKLICTG